MAGRTAALVPAAGRGERLGPGTPKALRELAGQPLLVHAVRSLLDSRVVDLIVVAAPAEHVEDVRGMLDSQDLPGDISVVTGGDTRQESVARALIALPADVDVVLVHDAARPLVPPEVTARVVAAVRDGHAAVVPGLRVADTIKAIGAGGDVVTTLDRDQLRAIQTPQGFNRDTLRMAHAAADDALTDDAGLIERAGGTVHVVDGHEEAFKVTRPLDLLLAEAVLARRRVAGPQG